jgi:hypothetical protein
MLATMQFRIFYLPISCLNRQRYITHNTHRVNVQCLRIPCYAVPHNKCYTLLLENISLYFKLQQVFELVTCLSFFFLRERDCTPLKCFYNGCIQ